LVSLSREKFFLERSSVQNILPTCEKPVAPSDENITEITEAYEKMDCWSVKKHHGLLFFMVGTITNKLHSDIVMYATECSVETKEILPNQAWFR